MNMNTSVYRKKEKKMKKISLVLISIFSILMLTACGQKKEKVVIYTALEESSIQTLKEQIKNKFPNYDVVVQYMATGNSAAKIKNEGTNIEADIILDLETAQAENVKENFADISGFDTSKYLDGINNSNKYLILAKYTMNLIIDKKYFEEHNLKEPKTYEDLLKPEYKNLIAMPDPKTSGTGYGFYLNAVNVMGENNAIEYFKKLKNNLREFTTSGSGPTNLLKQGEIAIAMGMTQQGVEAINEGYDFKIIELETGSVYNTTSYTIIKDRENKESVKEVFTWLINEFQPYIVEHSYPDVILKNQESKMENYPTNLKDADMKNIESVETKNHLLELWSKVNG